MTLPSDPCPYGFRIVGPTTGTRRLVGADRAWQGYLACDADAKVDREGYLSAFTYGADFQAHLKGHGSTAGFSGACCAPYIWFDIDRPGDIGSALQDTSRLVLGITDSMKIATPEELFVFFSGSKGFHVGLPTSLFQPGPSPTFNRVARTLAEKIAQVLKTTIDPGVYDKVRAFRAPNSKHPKTKLHKIVLPIDFWEMTADQVVQQAQAPIPVERTAPSRFCAVAKSIWDECQHKVDHQVEKWASSASPGQPSALYHSTRDFIINGADPGERNHRLFSAARNLVELGCPDGLAHALLEPAARNSGLPPREIHRTIESAFHSQATPPTGGEGGGHAT